jgi:hypothetical protein
VTGLPSGVTVEIEFTAGVWTDVTAYVAAEDKVSARFGRSTEFDDVNAATCTLVLRNDDGRFTPDSAGSPYYPDVIEGRRLRVTVIESDTAGFTGLVAAWAAEPETLWPGLPTDSSEDGVYPLFTGSILSWEPNYAGGMLSSGTVTVTANDALATLALHTFDSRWVEETRALARTAATWADVYVLKGDATTTAWNNIGVSTGGAYGTATLIPNTAAVGEVSYGTPASLTLEGSAEFKPSTEVGTVAYIVTPPTRRRRCRSGCRSRPGRCRRPRCTSWTPSAAATCSVVRLENNAGACDLAVYNAAGSSIGTLQAGWRRGVASDLHHRLRVVDNGHRDDDAGTVGSVTVGSTDLTTCTRLFLGGEFGDGTAAACAPMLIAGLTVAGDTSVVPSYLRGAAGADVRPHRPVRLAPVLRPRADRLGHYGRRDPHRRGTDLGGTDGAGRVADHR